MSTVLIVKNLRKSYGNIEALRGISFNVNKGEIVGLLGPNGAGKTTTIRIILGLLNPDEGEVQLNNITHDDIAFILEKDGLFEKLSVYENLKFYAKLFGLTEPFHKIEEITELLGIEELKDRKIVNLSRGQRRKVVISRALLKNPDFLILDEPTSGLDPMAQIQLQDVILELKKRNSLTVLLASHNLHEVQRICDRILIINKGVLKFEGNTKEIKDSRELENIFRRAVEDE